MKRRRTRIVATIGPACEKPTVLEELIRSGVDVFRLNFSHSDHAHHRTAYEAIRAASQRIASPVAVLADLCGPKIRVGRFPEGKIELVPGTEVVVTTRPDAVGGPGLIPSQYEPLARAEPLVGCRRWPTAFPAVRSGRRGTTSPPRCTR